MVKYKLYFEDMLKQNKELFDNFRAVHDNYVADPKKYKAQFDELGREVQDVVRYWENRLCGKSQSSGYSKFATELADKFQAEVKKSFPKINQVGLEID